jgi:hypothetical protein
MAVAENRRFIPASGRTDGQFAVARVHGPNARRGMGSTFGPHADP